MHVLRSIGPKGTHKHMHLPYLTPYPKWVICLLPAKQEFTGILLMYPLYWGPDVPCNMLSYLFSCGDSIATLPVPSFILLHVYLCVQCLHVPESPAKLLSQPLWTPVTFFWLGSFAPYFGKVLRYRYLVTSRSLLVFCALQKNHFFMLPSICKLLLCSLGF